MYQVPHDVVRDGYLVAFEGQILTDEEAKELKLDPAEKPKRAAKRKTQDTKD